MLRNIFFCGIKKENTMINDYLPFLSSVEQIDK